MECPTPWLGSHGLLLLCLLLLAWATVALAAALLVLHPQLMHLLLLALLWSQTDCCWLPELLQPLGKCGCY
jgi:hypothetical protein